MSEVIESDLTVVGSALGGAVAGCRLGQAGLRVPRIERPQSVYEGSVGLIANAQNCLGHREPTDWVYERPRPHAPDGARKSALRRYVVTGYAHVDLLRPRARDDIYPVIEDSLDPTRASDGLVKRSEAAGGDGAARV